MTVPTTAACRRPRDVGVRHAVRVALAARAGGVDTGPRRPAPLEPLLSPPLFGRSDRGAASASCPPPGQAGLFRGVQRGAPPRAPPHADKASGGQVARLSARSAIQRPAVTTRRNRSASRAAPRGDSLGAIVLRGAVMHCMRISSVDSMRGACTSGSAGVSLAHAVASSEAVSDGGLK